MYLTQKARGLALAQRLAESARFLHIHSPKYHVLRADSDTFQSRSAVAEFMESNSHASSFMVRPAPNRPRHGFVESRSVTRAEFATMFPLIRKEVVGVEPEAEIILMPYIEAEYNFILSGSGVVVGKGHDGATAGKQVVYIPAVSDLVGHLRTLVSKEQFKQYGIGEDEDAYIEAVSTGFYTYLTQVRAGPVVGASRDFIPGPVTVTRVHVVDTDDLLAWEKTAVELKNEPGVVVFHHGGAVSSHFGVHCAINKVPYVTTRVPVVGEELEPTTTSTWGPEEYEKVARYVQGYSDQKLTSRDEATEALIVCIATLHAMTSLTSTKDESAMRLVGFAMAYLPHLFTALATGESRHAPSKVRFGASKYIRGFMPHVSLEAGRDTCYSNTLSFPLEKVADLLARAHTCFEVPSWGSGYGGAKWAECTKATVTFFDAVMKFAAAGTEDTFVSAVSAFNVAVNKAHNNGWWLNKLIDQTVMDVLPHAPVLGLAKGLVYRLLSGAAPERELNTDGPSAKKLARDYSTELQKLLDDHGISVSDINSDDDDSDDDDDSSDDSTSESSDWGEGFGTNRVTPSKRRILRGVVLHVNAAGHFQVPGKFAGMNNRDWGISGEFTSITSATTMEMLRISANAFVRAPATMKVPSLNAGNPDANSDPSSKYLQWLVRLEGSTLIFNVTTSNKGVLNEYAISSTTMSFEVDVSKVPSLSFLKYLNSSMTFKRVKEKVAV